MLDFIYPGDGEGELNFSIGQYCSLLRGVPFFFSEDELRHIRLKPDCYFDRFFMDDPPTARDIFLKIKTTTDLKIEKSFLKINDPVDGKAPYSLSQMTVTDQNPDPLEKHKAVRINNPLYGFFCAVGTIDHAHRPLLLCTERDCHEVALNHLVDGSIRGFYDDRNFFPACRLSCCGEHLVQEDLEIIPECCPQVRQCLARGKKGN